MAGPTERLEVRPVEPPRIVFAVKRDDVIHFGDRNAASRLPTMRAERILAGVAFAEPMPRAVVSENRRRTSTVDGASWTDRARPPGDEMPTRTQSSGRLRHGIYSSRSA